MDKPSPYRESDIAGLIRTVRGQKVILDADLASLYRVPTKRLNEQVRRNLERFPPDFLFRLTPEEAAALRSQIATLKTGRGQHRKYLPYAFTENGAIMAANVLNSPQAVRLSVFVVRAFIQMRELLTGTKELAQQLAALERKLSSRLDVHESAMVDVLQRIMRILDPPPPPPEPPAPQIGFHVREEATPYRIRKKPPAPRAARSPNADQPALGRVIS